MSRRHRIARSLKASLLLLAVCLPVAAARDRAEGRSRADLADSQLIETTRVQLILLDVEVVDRSGRPVTGLRRDDFEIVLDGRRWPIYSVDDLCTGAADPEGADPGPTAVPVEASDSPRFVLYFDFSETSFAQRNLLLDEARRWVREKMRPGDLVLVEAFSILTGLLELQSWTNDARAVLAAIDRATNDQSLIDTFDPKACSKAERISKYFHGRRALNALTTFLGELELLPGRKSLLLFHDTAKLYPADEQRFRMLNFEVGDQARLIEHVGAAATSARTRIFSYWRSDLDATLADFSGGTYARIPEQFADVVDRSVRGARCVYRVGLKPPEEAKPSVHSVRVTAAGREVAHSFRVRARTEEEDLALQVRAVLKTPGGVNEIPLASALVPARISDGSWTVALQVAVDTSALAAIAHAGDRVGSWEVGGVLRRLDEEARWTVFGISRMRQPEDPARGRTVVHAREFEGLAPGSYEFRGYVRDRRTGALGGTEARLDLPDPSLPGAATPVLRRAEQAYVTAPLPILARKSSEETVSKTLRYGAVPCGDGPITAGGPLDITTWICSGDPAEVARYVDRDGVPVFALPPASSRPSTDCVCLTDRIDTAGLVPGRYTYHLRPPAADAPCEVSFEIRADGVAGVPDHPVGRAAALSFARP